jgi:hypothetical protein
VRAEVKKRTDEIFNRTFRYFTTGGGASLPIFQDIVTHDKAKYTEPEYNDAVKGFIEKVQTSTITPANPAMRPPPLFTTAHIAAHPYATTLPATLPISQVEANLADILHAHLEQGIHDAIHAAIKDVNGQAAKKAEAKQQTKKKDLESLVAELEDLHDKKGGGHFHPGAIDVEKWITTGVKYMKPHDRQRLMETGLVSFPAGVDESGRPYEAAYQSKSFSQLKNIKLGSAIATAAFGTAIGATILTIGGPIGFGIATGLAVVNWGVQKFLEVRHNNVLERTFKEIRSELNKTKPDGCVAWAGLLYKFIKEANPLWLAPNRTQLFGTAGATHVPAILSHLASAAAVAITEEHGITSYTKGMNYKDHLNLADKALNNLEKRWNWWHDKQKMVAPYVAVGCAAGTASIFAKGLVPLIP